MARPDEGGEELIYGLARPCWNRGLGHELLAALVDFAAERGIDPLRATVHPDNKASIALLERQGFRRRSRAEAADANDLLFERQADPSASTAAAALW
jgi:RimJ/RimL family protein N-acetyltransferase